MRERGRFWTRWWLELGAALLLLTPVLALSAAGFVWLWQQGWLLEWLLAVLGLTATAWAVLRLRHGPRGRARAADEAAVTQPDATWAEREQAAWDTVRRLSSAADAGLLEHRRRALAAAREAVEAVARHYHPEHTDPALEFTLPELLLLSERVSARLRLLMLEHVPLSGRLKAGPLLRAWGYRPMLAAGAAHGRRAYSVLRIARLYNPLNALAAELRDHFMEDLFEHLSTNLRRRVARIWIEEIGRAAIELYSGRLRVDARMLAATAESEGLGGAGTPAAAPGPLRLLVAGRTKAGKSTLVNALLGELGAGVDVLPLTSEFAGYELSQPDAPPTYLIDSPGVDAAADVPELVERAFACDLVVWVVPAHRADRALDREALDALRARFAAAPERKLPPLIVVASHVDRLSPMREWQPPYDVDSPSSPKERSIRAALEAIAADLLAPIDAIVPMRLESTPPYNLDVLWLRLEAAMPEAQRAHFVRILRTAIGQRRWRDSWQQLVGAGRIVGWLVKR